jgi:hypothetical protein
VGPMQAVMQGAITILFYAIIIAAVWKLFSMASELAEIKAILKDIRSNPAAAPQIARVPPAAVPVASESVAAATHAAPVASVPVAPPPPPPAPIPAGPISLESAEALLREIEAEERALAAQSSKPVTS